MTLSTEAVITLIGLLGGLMAWLILIFTRLEHRLTAVETLLTQFVKQMQHVEGQMDKCEERLSSLERATCRDGNGRS